MNRRDLRNDNRPLVYVVDDEVSIRECLSSLPRSAQLSVETFSAEEFLTNAQFEALRWLILDVQLPGITGFDLREKLVTRDIKIPIIFLTGDGDIPIAVRAVKARWYSPRTRNSGNAKGSHFSKTVDWGVHVIRDGVLTTGQNPASSGPAAKVLLERLAKLGKFTAPGGWAQFWLSAECAQNEQK